MKQKNSFLAYFLALSRIGVAQPDYFPDQWPIAQQFEDSDRPPVINGVVTKTITSTTTTARITKATLKDTTTVWETIDPTTCTDTTTIWETDETLSTIWVTDYEVVTSYTYAPCSIYIDPTEAPHQPSSFPTGAPTLRPNSKHFRLVETQEYNTKGSRVQYDKPTTTISTISLPPTEIAPVWSKEKHHNHPYCNRKKLSTHYFLYAGLESSSSRFQETEDHYIYEGAFGFPKTDWVQIDLDHESYAAKRPVLRFEGTHAKIYNMRNKPIYIISFKLIPVAGTFPRDINPSTQKLDFGWKVRHANFHGLDAPRPSVDTLIYRHSFPVNDNQRIDKGQAFEIMYGPQNNSGEDGIVYDTQFYLADLIGCS
ncbi:uncharacterized protein DFL_004362 [Arthrobotrys flagrans]|uniref:Uncharacterized protein n=1 Tax=Arthrobotrys flagrans TaxID=97331 RepID=A0A437A4M2_ARTFL|nr:hypothetical protein DFL_004362 [Arthrobotrys flagrans]